MRFRQLGKSGLSVSVIGVGTWQFGGHWGQDFGIADVQRILGRASEHGINLIDTAECYGDHLSESLIGAAIAGQRDRWVLATKFGHDRGSDAPAETHWQPASVQQQLEKSLKALGTDCIDVYQFHSGSDAELDNDALWTMLHKQKEAGKIRSLGISIGQLNNIHQVDRATALGVDMIQVVYNVLKRGAEPEVLPSCQRQQLGVLARTPLASGFLGGKYLPGARFPGNDVRAMRKQEHLDAEIGRANKMLEQYAKVDASKAAWALAWCLKHPAITAVIPGVKSVAQLDANVRAVELLPPESRILASTARADA
ncbi:MAG: aldo/keto reductase [Gammaproteobacteria bacterium]|nr:MAG: aldo/keto reductase [Gammaproteobacteria bacterium]